MEHAEFPSLDDRKTNPVALILQSLRLIYGILQEISDNLIRLVHIGGNLRQIVFYIDLKPDSLSSRPALKRQKQRAYRSVRQRKNTVHPHRIRQKFLQILLTGIIVLPQQQPMERLHMEIVIVPLGTDHTHVVCMSSRYCFSVSACFLSLWLENSRPIKFQSREKAKTSRSSNGSDGCGQKTGNPQLMP